MGNFGWNNSEIKKAIRNSKAPDYIHPGFHYKPWDELAEQLVAIAPGKLRKCFRTTGGTEAVDGALQLAMLYTERKKFLSIEGAYHGNSIATFSIGSNDQYKNKLPYCLKLAPPLDSKAIQKLETLLKKKDIAAFIMEPIICNLGVMIPDYDFMKTVQKLCKKYGTLLIMDEVATGFCRTGKVFACEHFGIHPDIMTLGKAITGGCAAMGAILATEEIAKKVEKAFFLYSTYGWHPLSVDASLATLKYLEKNKDKILSNVNTLYSLFFKRLNEMKFKKLENINAIGLIFGIKLKDAVNADRIKERCKKKGLLISAEEETIMLIPPLTIDSKIANAGLDILEESVG